MPHADLQRFWRWTDRLRAEAPHASTLSEGGGEGGSCTAKKKHLSCRRHSDKSAAARKYDFTPGGMRELVGKAAERGVSTEQSMTGKREPGGAPSDETFVGDLKEREEEGVGFGWEETTANCPG